MEVNDVNQQLVEEIIKEVMSSMEKGQVNAGDSKKTNVKSNQKMTKRDYPLANKRPELINTPTGKELDDITLAGVLDNSVKVEDVGISPQTLELQAEVADSMGRKPFARNLRRAAELIAVPDERILEIYNALRPYRSTKEELLTIADELESKYDATMNANLVRESAKVYESRNRLKKD